ncbi:SR-related and CTD-associated factor 4-like isoform X1 [Anguilla anguilla]|uniref:SR-related and CTD-associated factor 4-like isoform X1 n=1 Tax=Anguilla anguilla TaxID=7936 RepID=UPI0015AD290D|nr:SR-related and CTD-associated factor 4-like isoform X1 [Anguilla anguilla]
MDAVNAFNQELFSLIDMKPPISRAKMMSITKSAIKAIKLYKHVVQIVEKFIKKCKPDLKVPGLYVVDSIVRQSRHQFGVDKDVFGPRFTKNITGTFHNLYLCPNEDKSKIVRVLNLWQKNGVFKIEIIQPLLDMAAGASASGMPDVHCDITEAGSPAADVKVTSVAPPPGMANLVAPPPVTANYVAQPTLTVNSVAAPPVMGNSVAAAIPQLQNPEALAAMAHLFQSSQGQQLQQILQNFHQPGKPHSPALDNSAMAQLQASANAAAAAIAQHGFASAPPVEQKTTFDKKLLDRFDYDDEPDAAEEAKKEEPSPAAAPPAYGIPEGTQLPMQQPVFPQGPAQMPNMEHYQSHTAGLPHGLAHQVPLPPNGQLQTCGLVPPQPYPGMMPPMGQPVVPQQVGVGPPGFVGGYPPQNEAYGQHMVQQSQGVSMEIDQPMLKEGRHRLDGRRSRSGSRSPRRRRSRSNSRSRRSRYRRSRSRSRERRRGGGSPRSQSQERGERERERERRQRGLPRMKTGTLSVCSTTLWVGQLDKRTQQQDVACLLEEFGQIESINMIPPRGCAYIVMVHRQDAFRALQKLSRGPYKVNQKTIKIAWALNKGIKAEYKQYWDVELGVTYIPWNKVKPDDLESFREGGMLDGDTLCPEWKGLLGVDMERSGERAQNGGLEPAHAEDAAAAASSRAQMPSVQPVGVVGALHPPSYPPPMGLPPPSFPPGVPPPPPPPFLRQGFNPMQMPPGFPPPGGMPPMGNTGPPAPTPGVNIPTSAVPGSSGEAPSKDSMGGSYPPPPSGGGPRNTSAPVDRFPVPGPNQGVSGNLPAPMSQPMANNQMGPGGPVMSPQPPTGGLLGARPGMIPLQRPPGAPPPHMHRFPPHPPRPNMPPMPPPMMPRGPPQMMHREPPPGGFGMPPPHPMRGPFPPPGPPFMRGPEGPDDWEGRPPRGDRPGFGRDREPERFRGRQPYGRGGGEGRDHYAGRHEDPEQQGGWDRERDGGRDWKRSPEREEGGGAPHWGGGHRERPRERRPRERVSRWDTDGPKERVGGEADAADAQHKPASGEAPSDSGKEPVGAEPPSQHSTVTVEPQPSPPMASTEPTEKSQEAES